MLSLSCAAAGEVQRHSVVAGGVFLGDDSRYTVGVVKSESGCMCMQILLERADNRLLKMLQAFLRFWCRVIVQY